MAPEDLLSGGPGEQPAGADELRRIVARASRRRWRTSAVAAAIALAVGGGVGYAVSNHSSPAQTVVAGSGSSATTGGNGSSAPSGAAIGAISSSGATGSGQTAQKFTHLFTRSVGAVTIRGYQTNSTLPKLPAGVAGCVGPYLGPGFVAEVSTPVAVGTSMGFQGASTDVVKSVQSTLIGVQEGSPTAIVVAYTGSSVASVRVQFATGVSDQMTPVQGWAVLVASFPAVPPGLSKPVGTLQALGSSGQTLKSMTVELGVSPLPEPPVAGSACGCPVPAGGVSPGRSGQAGSGSGTASSGAVSSPGNEAASSSAPTGNYVCPMIKAGSPATSIPMRTGAASNG